MRRLFWLGVGAGVGVFVVRKASRTAEALSPSGLGASFAGLTDAVGAFADDVRAAMAEHEAELMSALGVDADGTAATPLQEPSASTGSAAGSGVGRHSTPRVP